MVTKEFALHEITYLINKTEESGAQRYLHSFFHQSVSTEIIIEASAEKVWAILMNADELSKWSTSFQGFTAGELIQGGQVEAQIVLFGKARPIKHTLSSFQEGRKFAWSDPIVPGLKDSHQFIVIPLSKERTKFIQKDEVRGWSVPLLGTLLTNLMVDLYTDFNQKLKQASEA